VQKDLVEYVKITSNHPHLFVPYGVLIGQVGEMSSTTIPFLGCSKGGKELIGHLSVRPKEINADLLYFVSSQACDAVFVLNEAGYMLQIKNLETAFQVCRVGRQEFQVRLGELSAALMYLKWLITEEGSFVAYDKRIPCKSREARQVNSHFLDHFLKTIVQIAKDCHLPDFTTESLESKATSQAQERNYDVGKVNESFYEIQKDIDVWYGCTPSSPVQWGSDKQGYLTSSHAIVETANVI